MKGKIILGVLGAIGFFEYKRYSAMMDAVSMDIRNLKLGFEGSSLKVDFQIEFINNSQKSIDVKSIDGVFYMGNVLIGRYKTKQETTIKANSVSYLPVTAIINGKEILQNIQGKELKSQIITLKTRSKIAFKIAGLLGFPVYIMDETKIDAGDLKSKLANVINKIVAFFKK